MGLDVRIDRRQALKEAAAALALIAGDALPTIAVAAGRPAAADAADVQRIATFLTGKADLADEFIRRAHAALVAEDPSFEQRLQALVAQVRGAGLGDVEQFKASPLARDTALMATAMALVSALYLGYVDGPDGGRLVSYEAALMWRPTLDASVIPTYAPAAPGWWAEPPEP